MRIDFDRGLGTLYIAYAGRYDFAKPIFVASSLESLEKSLQRYLLSVRPLFPIVGGVIPTEVWQLLPSPSLLFILPASLSSNGEGCALFNLEELGIEAWYVVKEEGGEDGEEPKSVFVSFVETDHEWNKNELSDLRERLRNFALSLGSDWFYSSWE